MRKLKATGKVSHESAMEVRPEDPGGYITDAELALQYGLIDHVFAGGSSDSEPELSGARLNVLLKWISLQQESFPRASVRTKLTTLFKRLQQRPKWKGAPCRILTHEREVLLRAGRLVLNFAFG